MSRTTSHLGHQRDHAVRRSARLRAALVGGATAASIGVAGVLGATALASGQSPSASTQPPTGSTSTGSTSTGGTSTGGTATGGTAKSGLVADLHTFGQGQPVSSGGGSTVATTKGS